MKKGFTLIEIIIALIISAAIGAYLFIQKQKSNFTSSVSKFTTTLVQMIESGVIDPTLGYPSNANSDCGGSGDYENISAGKVNDCVGWNYNIGGTKNDDGTKSYLQDINFLGAYTADGKGCKVYFDEDSSDTKVFYIFVDCSNLNYNNEDRYKKYVEEMINFTLKSNLSTIYQETYTNATAVDNTSGGDEKDGKIMLKFKK